MTIKISVYIFGGKEGGVCVSSSWDKIRLYTENQLPGLSGSALKVSVVLVGQPIPLSPPPTVELN